MTIILSQTEFRSLFEVVRQDGEFSSQPDAFETILKYPNLLGQGYHRDIQLRSGLFLGRHPLVTYATIGSNKRGNC